jgi:hypothetical protein
LPLVATRGPDSLDWQRIDFGLSFKLLTCILTGRKSHRLRDSNKLGASDQYVAHIRGQGVDGKRYCHTVEVTGGEMTSGAAQVELQQKLALVIELGPSSCCPIDGGELPTEAEMPELE